MFNCLNDIKIHNISIKNSNIGGIFINVYRKGNMYIKNISAFNSTSKA